MRGAGRDLGEPRGVGGVEPVAEEPEEEGVLSSRVGDDGVRLVDQEEAAREAGMG
jgi:hypothetical protein